jgi:hypothetical protein
MLRSLILLCGIGHIALGLGSLAIPKLLNWNKSLSGVPTLIRQMFWVYAGYILAINFFFGVISILFVDELLSGRPLPNSILALIALYWFARVIIQFTYFDRKDIPAKGIFLFGEIALNILFVAFTGIYSWAFFESVSWN